MVLASLMIVVGATAPAATAQSQPAGIGRADEPVTSPSQQLRTDPQLPYAQFAIEANAAAIIFADYAIDVWWAPDRWWSAHCTVGLTRRYGADALLAEVGLSIWPLGDGLSGGWISVRAGVAYAGGWNGSNPDTRQVVRYGAAAGWQFLWGELALAIGGGAQAVTDLSSGESWLEPAVHAAIGFVAR